MLQNTLPYFFILSQKPVGIDLKHNNILPEPYMYNDDNIKICVLGNPILEGRINKEGLVKRLMNPGRNINPQTIDGEFLIVCLEKENNILSIISDRFCSIPLFYFIAEGNKFVASTSYTCLWQEYSLYNHINEYVFFEFMWLHRLLGNKTFDTKSSFLPSASILTYDGQDIVIKKYWKPSFRKTTESLDDCANELARLLKLSINMKTSDNPKAGLFLSGGRDSRTVLAAFDKPPVCFTLTVSKNREYLVARKLASLKNAKHVYLRLPEDKYSRIYKKAVRLSGGMYLYDHAIFLDYGHQVLKHANVAFHGYGLDFMFQGMYIPAEYLKIFNKQIYIPSLQKIQGLTADYYINNIAYRLKGVNLLEYMKPQLQDEYFERLKQSAKEVLENSDVEFYNNYDEWEYLIIHALSRHYTYSNVTSLSTYIEQRTVTFQNDLFNLFLSLPLKYRFDGRISRRTLNILNPRMANVISANSGTRAVGSCYERALLQVVDGFWSKTRRLLGSEMIETENKRTWFSRDPVIRNEPQLSSAVQKACCSEQLNQLGFLNMDKVSTDVEKWLKIDKGGGPFMTTLIHVNEFLNLAK